MRAQARLEGRAEGYAEGLAEAAADLASAFGALAAAADEVRASAAEAAGAVEREAAQLAVQIAEKVLAASLAVQPERVLDVVRGALRCLLERERVTVLVNPADMDVVRQAADAVCAELGGLEHLEVQEERRVTRGGAVVRSATGEVDARLEIKLERLREVVERALTGT